MKVWADDDEFLPATPRGPRVTPEVLLVVLALATVLAALVMSARG